VIRVYDTLARAKVEVVSREPGRLSIYVCGPTVYEVPHVGHGRAAVVFDVIRRYLAWRGFAVTFVSNITDVEDKIIARAAREGRSEAEVAARFEDAYWESMDRLDIDRPDELPRATEYIGAMLELIGELIDAGCAYVVEGQGVYFDVTRYDGYGELSARKIDDLLEGAGARVDVDERKRSPVDFAVWKAAKPGEPRWPSPWGEGRPGWHIECSAMSLALLGEGFDLHGGGDDLVFPHHENERAQAEGAGHPFARYWLHNGMVMVGDEKMAKSRGNFTTLADALDAHGPRAVRMAVLQTHYRRAMELGDGELGAAARAVDRLDALARRARAAGVPDESDVDATVVADFRAAMDDDFATPAAMAVVFDAVSAANAAIDAGDTTRAATLVATTRELLGAVGLSCDDGSDPQAGPGEPFDGEVDVDAELRKREAARAAREYATADRIRAELDALGVVIEDTAAGPVWHRR